MSLRWSQVHNKFGMGDANFQHFSYHIHVNTFHQFRWSVFVLKIISFQTLVWFNIHNCMMWLMMYTIIIVYTSKAEEITLTIGQAFDLAYRRFLETSGQDLDSKKQCIVLQKKVCKCYIQEKSIVLLKCILRTLSVHILQ